MKNKNLTQLELDFIASKKLQHETVIVNGNVVIVKYDGKSKRKGVAYCDPNDVFDITVGYKVAKAKIELLKLQEDQEWSRSNKKDIEADHKKHIQIIEEGIKERNKKMKQLKYEIKNPSKMQEEKEKTRGEIIQERMKNNSLSLHGIPIGSYQSLVHPLSLTLGTTEHLK